MYLRIKEAYEKKTFIKFAYSDFVGKTMYCYERNIGGITTVYLSPTNSRKIPDDWLETESDKVIDILDKYTDIGIGQETIYWFLSLSRADKEERIATWNEVEKFGQPE